MVINLCVLLSLLVHVTNLVNVNWTLDSNPAYLEDTVYLTCTINDTAQNCSTSLKQWHGGKEYRSLCRESRCGSSKYEVMPSASCNYVLMIHNFSVSDINCYYTCSYGISNMRMNLRANDGHFIYHPKKKDINLSYGTQNEHFQAMIKINKIYPAPVCSAMLLNENKSVEMSSNITQSSFYYKAVLMIDLDTWGEGVWVFCELQGEKVNITTISANITTIPANITSIPCYDYKDSSNTTVYVILPSAAVVLFVVVAVLTYFYKRRNKHTCTSLCKGRKSWNGNLQLTDFKEQTCTLAERRKMMT